MRGILKMVKNVDLEHTLGKMEGNIQECIKMIKRMDMESSMI
jgi:hypothetical protein